MDLSAKIDAMFKFVPRGSQQLVVLYGLVAAIAAGVAMAFCLTSNPRIAVVPGIIFLVSAGLSTAMWWRSHLTNDLENAKPITFKQTEYGLNVAVDARLIPNSNSLMQFSQALQSLSYRQPLPAPNGMVRPDGSPDASRRQEAARITDEINQETLRLTAETVTLLRALQVSALAAPPVVQSDPVTSFAICGEGDVVNTVAPDLQRIGAKPS